MRTIVFDLDGTLADTAGDLIAACNTALRELGFESQLEIGVDDATAFAGGRAMLRLAAERMGANEDLVEAGYPLLLAAYGREMDTYTSLYAGAREAVGRLKARGDALGICTNKPEAFAIELIEKLGLTEFFPVLIGADTLPVRKPDPEPLLEVIRRLRGEPARSVLSGDTVTDRKTGAAAGVPVVLVTFGPTGRDVASLEPEALLDHYDDLEAVLDRLGGPVR